jgi:hypothetical protein
MVSNKRIEAHLTAHLAVILLAPHREHEQHATDEDIEAALATAESVISALEFHYKDEEPEEPEKKEPAPPEIDTDEYEDIEGSK